jgi:hypothetical protein
MPTRRVRGDLRRSAFRPQEFDGGGPPRPIGRLGVALTIALTAAAVPALVSVVVRIEQWQVVREDQVDVERWQSLDHSARIIEAILAVLSLVVLPLLVVWSRRLADNHRRYGGVGISDPDFVGQAWVIPWVNVPLEMVFLERLWRGADPKTTPGDGRRGRGSILPVVWMVATGSALTAWLEHRFDPWRNNATEAVSRWDLTCSVSLVVAALAGAVTTARLTSRQLTKLKRLQGR